MQSLCTSLASKEGAVISPAANAALGGVTCPPFLLPLSRRSLRASLKPPPAPCAASTAFSYVARSSLPSSLARTYVYARAYMDVRHGVRVQVCTTRDSSTSSTIHRVRRSTPPRFNIQTICNNFAATITLFLLPVPLSYLPPDFAALLLSPSLSLPLALSILAPPSSASPSLSFIPSPLLPLV